VTRHTHRITRLLIREAVTRSDKLIKIYSSVLIDIDYATSIGLRSIAFIIQQPVIDILIYHFIHHNVLHFSIALYLTLCSKSHI
jgi:hypothetical protein